MTKRERSKPRPSFCRRDALKAIAAGVGVSFLPTFGMPRVARANLRPGAPARNLLVIDCIGGVRSSAAFYASQQTPLNPYGIIQQHTPFPIGVLLDDSIPGAPFFEPPPTSYQLASWNGLTMPSLKQFAASGGFSIVNTWDPGSGDHLSDLVTTATGDSSGGGPGLLTRVYAGLADAMGTDVPFPSFLINDQGAPYGKPGGLSRHVPVGLQGSIGLPGAATGGIDQQQVLSLAGNDWAADDTMRAAFDPTVAASRAATNYDLAQVYGLQRLTAHAIGGTLAQSFVNVANPHALGASYLTADVSKSGNGGQMVALTNQMLFDAFTNTLGTTQSPASNPNFNTAMNAAIAVRLLQLGSRAIAIDIGNYDAHSGETTYRPVYALLGRLWPALAFVLSRVPDPGAPGQSLFDTTLVCTISEFGRDAGGTDGYNAGGGTDHGNGPPTWSQAHAIMGAGVKGGRVFSAVSTDDFRGDKIAENYDAPTLLATLLYAMGIDYQNPDYGFDGVGNLPGLWS